MPRANQPLSRRFKVQQFKSSTSGGRNAAIPGRSILRSSKRQGYSDHTWHLLIDAIGNHFYRSSRAIVALICAGFYKRSGDTVW